MAKKTILVVDDKKEMVMLVQSYLAQEGYRVVTAANGREALVVARHTRPDLIILDLMMPEMGGTSLCRSIAKRPRPRSLCSPPSWMSMTKCWAWNWARMIT